MFGLKNTKLVKELKNIKLRMEWLKFSNVKKKINNDLIKSLIEENKFIAEEIKMRAMVEDMLEKEFTPKIKENKSYDFLVDSVIMRLKQKQIGEENPID